MSIYDRCNATADQNKAAQWDTYRQETWWKDKAIWYNPGICTSRTEHEAFLNIARECEWQPVYRRDELRAIVREVLTEIRQEREKQLLPLKDYLAARGETLYWRDPGLRPAAYVVPILTGT